MAKHLVIDTSMAACTVGLFDDTTPLFEKTLDMRQGHQEAIGGMVHLALSEAELKVSDLNKIGVTLGPGSFTGLRIGLSFAKGLSIGAGVKLCGLSALEAMLFHPDIENVKVMAMMDGGRGKLFVQARHGQTIGTANIIDTKDEEQLRIFIDSLTPDMAITGNGFDINWPFAKDILPQNHPHVRALNKMIVNGLATSNLTPLYMREADASVSRKPMLSL